MDKLRSVGKDCAEKRTGRRKKNGYGALQRTRCKDADCKTMNMAINRDVCRGFYTKIKK